jgi:2-polyprenyl-3-methyl-5-hydroxy-6-metoxy-1,4-benzoquinol methylase
MTQKFNYVEHYKIDAEEFDYFEERTGATAHDERRVHEYILSKVKKNVKNILDVGAGSAWVAQHFKSSEVNVVSLDISLLNVKKAKSLVPTINHTQLVADSFKLPFGNYTFDCVIASEIIEHVVDPRMFIEELFRVVRPSGNLIITTPYKEKLRYYLCVHCNKKTPIHAHIHSFDEQILLKIAPENIRFSNHFIFGNKYLIFLRTYILLKYFPFRLWKLIDSFFNKIKNVPVHIMVEYFK